MTALDWITLTLWTSTCLALEGFFSGSEIALVSCDKLNLAHRAARGDRGAKMTLTMAGRPDWFFSATLLGQNFFIVANTVVVTFFILDHYGAGYEFLAILLSPLILVFGEALPKSLFQQVANRVVTRTTPLIVFFSYGVFPIVWVLSKLTLLLLGGVKGSLIQDQKITPESLEILIQESEPQSNAHHELSLPLKNTLLKILNFSRHRVEEIMTPLVEVFSIRETATVEEALTACVGEGYSKIPVFQKRAHNIIAVVRRLDLLREVDLKRPLIGMTQPALYITEGLGVKELFLTFRRTGQNFAVVVDEYGGAVGVVSLEDILEEIVGEIEDEYDKKKSGWVQLSPSRYLFDGRVEIDEINEKFKWGIPKGGYKTLAGFIIEKKRGFPAVGETLRLSHLPFGDLILTVKEASSRGVNKILVEIKSP